MKNVTINKAQGLYVFKRSYGVSCLGFEVAERQRQAVLSWLGLPVDKMRLGTKRHAKAHADAMELGAAHNAKTGARCNADLIPALTGLEGKRVEVTTPDGFRSRFIVGKSTGWMPIHLEIKRRDSSGGCGAYVPDGSTVRVIN